MLKFFSNKKYRDLFKRLRTVLIELLIVFVGVYAAFSLDRWNDGREAERQREQILLALLRNVEVYLGELREVSEEFELQHYGPFIEAYENGEMPSLEAIPMGGSGLSSDFWSAMLQAGGLEVLDIETIGHIESYYTVLRFAVGRITAFDEVMTTQLAPNLDNGLDEFYDTDKRRLRKRYEWYPRMLTETNRQLKRVSDAANSLVAQLQGEVENTD